MFIGLNLLISEKLDNVFGGTVAGIAVKIP
jgi:hypothetical protein